MSVPLTNALSPAPRSTTTRTSASASSRSMWSWSASYISNVMEFRASGRLIVRSATRPSRSSRMSLATPVVTVGPSPAPLARPSDDTVGRRRPWDGARAGSAVIRTTRETLARRRDAGDLTLGRNWASRLVSVASLRGAARVSRRSTARRTSCAARPSSDLIADRGRESRRDRLAAQFPGQPVRPPRSPLAVPDAAQTMPTGRSTWRSQDGSIVDLTVDSATGTLTGTFAAGFPCGPAEHDGPGAAADRRHRERQRGRLDAEPARVPVGGDVDRALPDGRGRGAADRALDPGGDWSSRPGWARRSPDPSVFVRQTAQ